MDVTFPYAWSPLPSSWESSLADDVARLRQVLDRQDGPTIVAGHSYGGQIMTALGTVTVEVPAGHLAMVSHPDDAAQLIKTAAEAVQTAR
jgi:predicted alpha/beta hydrolase family esterase